MHAGMSVVDVCRIVGIPSSSVYYIIENTPVEIAEAQALIEVNNLAI